jgi:hypothetical protein
MMAKLFSRPTIGLLILLTAPVFAGVVPGDAIGTFDISQFEVEGNTVLNASAVQSLLASFVGKNRDFGYVERRSTPFRTPIVSTALAWSRLSCPSRN